MALAVTRASDAAEDLATMAGAAVLGSITIPGQPDHVRTARTFVGKALGELGTITDTAVLLTSELVTNAVRHSNSREPGGTVVLVVLEVSDGVRVEVTDNGSDLSLPVVKGDVFSADGHGLYLVETLAVQWGYLRDQAGTTVWFRLCTAGVTAPDGTGTIGRIGPGGRMDPAGRRDTSGRRDAARAGAPRGNATRTGGIRAGVRKSGGARVS
jgi:anti-sigma regulatory factor (Ser/Thr protein kinase)